MKRLCPFLFSSRVFSTGLGTVFVHRPNLGPDLSHFMVTRPLSFFGPLFLCDLKQVLDVDAPHLHQFRGPPSIMPIVLTFTDNFV